MNAFVRVALLAGNLFLHPVMGCLLAPDGPWGAEFSRATETCIQKGAWTEETGPLLDSRCRAEAAALIAAKFDAWAKANPELAQNEPCESVSTSSEDGWGF